jgi:nitric oxide reductase NorD protein
MDKAACKKRFYELVFPSLPNEWEVDQIIEEVAQLPEDQQGNLLDAIPAIWPISHSLGLSFLEDGSKVIDSVPPDCIPAWVRTILRNYEEEGLKGARRFILQVEKYFLEPLKKRNRVNFGEIEKQMLLYLRGISGEDLMLATDRIASTDTTTFYLPPAISLFARSEHNKLFFKFVLSLHWGFHRWGTFKVLAHLKKNAEIEQGTTAQRRSLEIDALNQYFAGFKNRKLAEDLFFLLETGRVMIHLQDELPGLTNRFFALKHDFVEALENASQTVQNSLSGVLTDIGLGSLFGGHFRPGWDTELILENYLHNQTTQALISSVDSLYAHLSSTEGPYQRPLLLELLGRHDFEQASAEMERKRLAMKNDFILQFRALQNSDKTTSERLETAAADSSAQTLLAIVETASENQRKTGLTTVDNSEVDIPQEFIDLIEKIEEDVGFIPKSYVSAASGVAGHGFNYDSPAATANGEAIESPGDMTIDEWDYRRNGYRKNWCTIRERQLSGVQSTFVAATLEKHRGTLLRLRRQFEMMKTSEHFVRRQREGDDLDLDAIVEAHGDQRAGICPSGKWFVRLQRNERDIVTVFLIDMSNSTEGWVGTVIKEALVLLCEVMDVAGDPYEILGFSGMRRSRCDLYHVKNIDESYNKLIRQRINAVVPREYTRMGPAVRYAVSRLKNYEARTRLLVTITDGKPEDYDDYKGEYAIEDTRKALQEARGSGIHSFGITVDREAHEYLPHMFGTGNYIFIDEIEKLPMRLVDMYRLLTV